MYVVSLLACHKIGNESGDMYALANKLGQQMIKNNKYNLNHDLHLLTSSNENAAIH